jgi:hypothetical protein
VNKNISQDLFRGTVDVKVMLLSCAGKSFYGKDGLQRLKRFRGFFRETNGKECI